MTHARAIAAAEAAVLQVGGAAAGVEQERDWLRYSRDPLAWVSECVQTFDPRYGPDGRPIGWIPFVLYDYQREYILWLLARYRERKDALTEKSRDMGASWCELALDLWLWVFEDNYQCLLGSRVEDLVDNWLPDSLFGKLAGAIERLPAWQLRKIGWTPRCRTYMKIVNPSNGSALTGQSANADFGRQGRYSRVFMDELAFWAWAASAWRSTADSSPCRHGCSTPNGKNTFAELRSSGRNAVYTLHWRLHPEKDDDWYRGECGRRTAEEVAQELDISYDKSVRGRVYPEWDSVPRGDFPYVHGWPLYVSWDFGLSDNTALVWWARNPSTGMFRAVDCYSRSGPTIDFYVPFVTGQMLSGLPYAYTAEDLAKVESHRGWPAAVHAGDPAGRQRNQVSGTSVVTELAKHGIYVQSRPDANTFEARWKETKLFLRQVEGVNEATCLALHDAMTNARFPERAPASQGTNESTKPIHDWTSHLRTAVEYFAVNVPQHPTQQAVKPSRARSAWEAQRGGGGGDGWASSRRAA